MNPVGLVEQQPVDGDMVKRYRPADDFATVFRQMFHETGIRAVNPGDLVNKRQIVNRRQLTGDRTVKFAGILQNAAERHGELLLIGRMARIGAAEQPRGLGVQVVSSVKSKFLDSGEISGIARHCHSRTYFVGKSARPHSRSLSFSVFITGNIFIIESLAAEVNVGNVVMRDNLVAQRGRSGDQFLKSFLTAECRLHRETRRIGTVVTFQVPADYSDYRFLDSGILDRLYDLFGFSKGGADIQRRRSIRNVRHLLAHKNLDAHGGGGISQYRILRQTLPQWNQVAGHHQV